MTKIHKKPADKTHNSKVFKVFQVKSLKSSFEVICIPRKNQDKPQATWAQPMSCEYLNGHWGNLEGVFEPQGQLCKADAIFT